MDIVIFKSVTTEGVITSIEENSKKYHDGLYANMNNLPERTMVKKGVAEIGDIIKALKTSRIAITKANTAAVNKEHDAIVERLTVANKPFTDLLDTYNAERKIVLDAEKARKQAILDLALFNRDHEMALLIDKTYAHDKEEAEIAEINRLGVIRIAAEMQAAANQKVMNEAIEQGRINDENARLANKEHLKIINNSVLFDLVIHCGLDETQAKAVIVAIAKKEITHLTINY